CASPQSHTVIFFPFNTPAPSQPAPLSLHDALPILGGAEPGAGEHRDRQLGDHRHIDRHAIAQLDTELLERVGSLLDVPQEIRVGDRKSTRLNSSHVSISYAVFCLKKKINHGNIRLP